MPTGFTTITASKIQDASGEPLASGRVTFYPVNSLGAPVSAIAGGGGGPILQSGVVFLVVNGSITSDLYGRSAQVADTTQTTPVNIAYRVTITDASGVDVQGPGYGLVQPSGSSWSLDTYVPVQPLNATVQFGPVPTFAIGTVATGTVASVTLTGGPLAYLFNFVIPVGSGGSGATYPTAIVFADAGNGNRYSLSIKDGQRQETLVAGSTPLTTTPLVLIDGISGTHYQLQFNGGAFQWFPVDSTVPGVASINLTDTDTATVKHWALVMNGAALQTASIL